MSINSISKGFGEVEEAHYFPFPKKPQTIKIGNYSFKEYVPELVIQKHLRALAEKINFKGFEAVLVNLEGGFWLFNELLRAKKEIGIRVEMIEYHKPLNGLGTLIQMPVPENLRYKNCLVVDAMNTPVLNEIMLSLGANSKALVVVDKNTDGLDPSKVMAAIKLDNKPFGGCGMNPGIKDENIDLRHYPGIYVVK